MLHALQNLSIRAKSIGSLVGRRIGVKHRPIQSGRQRRSLFGARQRQFAHAPRQKPDRRQNPAQRHAGTDAGDGQPAAGLAAIYAVDGVAFVGWVVPNPTDHCQKQYARR